jgi:hypothetical protein
MIRQFVQTGDRSYVKHRRAPRFAVRAPIIVELQDESGTSRQGIGFTRDMSRNGVFAWCEEECPPRHSEITMALLFPGIGPDAKPWRMRSTGRVVQAHDAQQGKGFAATLDDLGTAVLDDDPPWHKPVIQ